MSLKFAVLILVLMQGTIHGQDIPQCIHNNVIDVEADQSVELQCPLVGRDGLYWKLQRSTDSEIHISKVCKSIFWNRRNCNNTISDRNVTWVEIGESTLTVHKNHTRFSQGSLEIECGVTNGQSYSCEVRILRHPGPPILHNCPDDVIEGDDVTCTCLASPSHPQAVVGWSGAKGSHSEVLHLKNVSRALNGTVFTCIQNWAVNSSDSEKRINYTVFVLPPPVSVPPQKESKSTLMAQVGGGVVVVVVAGFIIAIIVIWIKSCDPVYSQAKRRHEVEDSHIYSDLASLPGSNAAISRAESSVTQYENAGFEDDTEEAGSDYLELCEMETSVSGDGSRPQPVQGLSKPGGTITDEQYENAVVGTRSDQVESYYENTPASEMKNADGGHYENIPAAK